MKKIKKAINNKISFFVFVLAIFLCNSDNVYSSLIFENILRVPVGSIKSERSRTVILDFEADIKESYKEEQERQRLETLNLLSSLDIGWRKNSTLLFEDRDREAVGYYVSPRRVVIAGIQALVVDPHNEVLPHWYTVTSRPSVVIHIDNHSDMSGSAPTFQTARKEWTWEKIDSIEKYAKHCLSVENFIAAAIHDGFVGVVYHFDPREEVVHAYGRVKNGGLIGRPKTKLDDRGRIKWDSKDISLRPEGITIKEFIEDLHRCRYPLILDIDLDAYLCIKDPIGQNSSVHQNRFRKVQSLIGQLPKPEIITIARSQTPTLWCPADKVNDFEIETVEFLELLYREKLNAPNSVNTFL